MLNYNKGGDVMTTNYEEKFLIQLSKQFPNLQSAATELINLNAIINLPKETEHFISDIHGEYDAFNHYLKNASGILKEKINQRFKDLDKINRRRLAFFVYYPTDMINKYRQSWGEEALPVLLRDVLKRMIIIAKMLATKHTKSHVRKQLPEEFAYIIQELLYESSEHADKERYINAIIDAIFETGRDKKLIIEVSRFIRRLSIDRLHIVGDIFDRGPKPHMVMDKIMRQKQVDIQWGNHDIIWMGAASGSEVMIANVIRIAARYSNLECLEDGYGINLRVLQALANKVYKKDPCKAFYPKRFNNGDGVLNDPKFVARMHKAISIIQFKLEKPIIDAHPEFNMADRLLLDNINHDTNTITIDGKTYALNEHTFPTVDPNHPYALSEEEHKVISHLKQLFLHNEKLQNHIRYLYRKGAMHLTYNNTLLFHAAVPLNADGSLLSHTIDGTAYQGKALYDKLEQKIRQAYLNRHETNNPDLAYFLMLWQSPHSPLFAKHAMKTFERYFVQDETTHKEIFNPYYKSRENTTIINRIFKDFGVDPKHGRIVNGHVPVDITRGDDVVLNNGNVYLIDGGMSKQYAKKTNIGGYTLISDSWAFYLVSHTRFSTYEALIESEKDIVSLTHVEDLSERRHYIYDTDVGHKIKHTINDLRRLITAYKQGDIKEKEDAKD